MGKKVDPAVAAALMRERGFEPLEPYPGALAPWNGRCRTCGEAVCPTYANVVTSGQGPCRACGGSKKISEADARALLARRGLAPLEPYPGNNTPWPALCSVCDGETAPTLTSVRKALKLNRGPGCDLCRRNGAIRPEDAMDMLRVAGATPRAPYPGIKRPWPSRCLHPSCRKEIRPALESIKHARAGACRYCGGHGIKADDEAVVYLLHHLDLGAAKVGITKKGSRRLHRHRSAGWQVVETIAMTGRQARGVESTVLERWRTELQLPYGATAADMPFAGYTETVKLADRTLELACQDLRQAAETFDAMCIVGDTTVYIQAKTARGPRPASSGSPS